MMGLINKYFGTGDGDISHCYANGIGKKARKVKKAKRRAQKQSRKNNR